MSDTHRVRLEQHMRCNVMRLASEIDKKKSKQELQQQEVTTAAVTTTTTAAAARNKT